MSFNYIVHHNAQVDPVDFDWVYWKGDAHFSKVDVTVPEWAAISHFHAAKAHTTSLSLIGLDVAFVSL